MKIRWKLDENKMKKDENNKNKKIRKEKKKEKEKKNFFCENKRIIRWKEDEKL